MLILMIKRNADNYYYLSVSISSFFSRFLPIYLFIALFSLFFFLLFPSYLITSISLTSVSMIILLIKTTVGIYYYLIPSPYHFSPVSCLSISFSLPCFPLTSKDKDFATKPIHCEYLPLRLPSVFLSSFTFFHSLVFSQSLTRFRLSICQFPR